MGKIKVSVLVTLIKYGWPVRRKRWYLKFPFIPLPPKKWLLWRMETAWGIDARTFKLQHLPPLRIIIRDVYKFGHWLQYIGRY